MSDSIRYFVADDDAVTGQALALLLGGRFLSLPERFDGDNDMEEWVAACPRVCSQDSVVLVNAHARLSGHRGDRLGLRVVDELILALGPRAPCPLVYSFCRAETLDTWLSHEKRDLAKPWVDTPIRFEGCGLPWANYVLRMPLSREDLFARCAQAREQWKTRSPDVRQRLRRDTAEAYAERIHRQVRHSLFSEAQRPAVRFLLGALHVKSRRDKVLQSIALLADEDKREEIRSLLSSARHMSLLDLSPIDTTGVAKRIRFLLIDDEVQKSGWREALEAALACTVDGVSSLPKEADGLKLERYDMVLLDYSFPCGTSADWLREAKAQYPEVPIVMFTMSDRAEVALWCLQHGATAYYAKEPYETLMRSSAAHFDRFCSLLSLLDKTEPAGGMGIWTSTHRVRQQVLGKPFSWWRQHLYRMDSLIKRHEFGSLLWHWGQLIRILLGNSLDFYLSRGTTLGGATHIASISMARMAYHAQFLMELLAYERVLECRPNYALEQIHGFLGKPRGGWRAKWAPLITQGMARMVKNRDLEGWDDLERISHWRMFLANPRLPTLHKMLDFLEHVVIPECVAATAPRASSPPPCHIVAESEAPAPEPTGRSRTHAEEEILGAFEMLHGLAAMTGSKNAVGRVWASISDCGSRGNCVSDAVLDGWLAELGLRTWPNRSEREALQLGGGSWLIIDDRPSSAFVTVLRLVLRHLIGKRVNVVAKHPTDPGAAPALETLKAYRLALLDLDFGTGGREAEDPGGMRWLRELRGKHNLWGVPVCIMTARLDSLNLRIALACGATGYLPKRTTREDPAVGLRYLVGQLANLCKTLPHLERLRATEARIRDLWTQEKLANFSLGPANKRNRLLINCLGLNENAKFEAVQEAISNALLSSWCYLFLNATRTTRADLWLQQLCCESDPAQVYLREALASLGAAVEPAALMAPHVLHELWGWSDAGGILACWKGLPRKPPFVGKLHDLWRWRVWAEHGGSITTRSPASQQRTHSRRAQRTGGQAPSLAECISLLDIGVAAIADFSQWFVKQSPW